MGSASSRSSQVHSFQVDHTASKDARPLNRSLSHESKNVQVRQSVQSTDENEEEKENNSPVSNFTCPAERDVLIVQLKKQLGESESNNLDLQDRIQMLEEQIVNIQSQNEITEHNDIVEDTLKAKDQIIDRTTQEKEQLQKDFNKQKMRLKKRIKVLTSQVNEARQETSIQLFELRDEINRLTEENRNLNEKLDNKEGRRQVFIETDYLSTSIHGNSSQMKVVLELSNQISDQQNKIQELESQLLDREELLKLNGISTEQITKSKTRFSENEHVKQEKSAMKKLSDSMFPGNDNVSDDENNIFSGDDNRGVSGASRDSGIGSAGKGGRSPVKSNKKKQQLSPLDDSDDSWASDTPLSSRDQNKTRSAPLETQHKRAASRSSGKTHESEEDSLSIDYDMPTVVKSAKMKKKTSFTQRLRRENDSSIRTPIPYEAFGGEEEKKSKKGYMKTKNHFFLTQASSQGSTPTNDIDALLMS
ncbi:unnamed protein product [Mytilus coruscus]|uniref:Uncharacterized protein n=1 Tax=Mytilus coruscus TaxID=42192 RepID=A0A6J8F1D9_MYTCO|nr:unnamed protein product [Mytilus coruscus]